MSLAAAFRAFVAEELQGSSPIYAALATACADDESLAEPLLSAPPGRHRPLLFMGAIHFVLRTEAQNHELAAHFRAATVPAAPSELLRDFVHRYRGDLAHVCANRTTQTNEAARTGELRPAFARVAGVFGNRPLGLVELGSSAGLLLLADRYAYRYHGSGRTEHCGQTSAPAALRMDVSVACTAWPEGLSAEPVVAARVGIDRSPVDVDDPESVEWLRSCVWPEHRDRMVRLDAALAEARRVRPRLVTGDMVATLPAVLSTVDDSVVPLVFSSHALTYLSQEDRSALIGVLADVGARRDLAVVFKEAPDCGAALVTTPPTLGADAFAMVTLIMWRNGRPSVEILAETGAHGAWLRWNPRPYGYRPRLAP